MADVNDVVNAVGSDNGDALATAGTILGTIGSFAGSLGSGISTVTQILQMLNVIQSPDQKLQNLLASIQSKIDTDFRKLENDIAAEGILAKQRDIDSGINSAAAIFQLLPTIVPELPSLEPDYILTQIQTCVAAIQFFTDYPDKWVIPWASLPPTGPGASFPGTPPNGYSDSWSGVLAPPQSQFVFNYVYVLPQFLRAIYITQTVILALDQPALAQPDIQAVFKKAASKLQGVHDTMQSGIGATKVPTAFDVANQGTSQGVDQWKSNWFGGQRRTIMSYWNDPTLWLFGAVEIYSTFNNIASYEMFMPYEFLPLDRPPVPDSFVKLVNLRVENSKKTLYKALGLPAVRTVINGLLAFTGQPVPAAMPYEAWSLRNAASILGLSASGGSPLRFHASLKSLLTATPPYTGGLTFPAEAQGSYPPTKVPTSFRSLFVPV